MNRFFVMASAAALVVGLGTASNAQQPRRDSAGAYQSRQVDRERGFDRQQGNRYYRSTRLKHHKPHHPSSS